MVRKDVLVCDMDETLGNWREGGYFDGVPEFLGRVRGAGVEPVVFTAGGKKKKRLEFLNPDGSKDIINHIWSNEDCRRDYFVGDDGKIYEPSFAEYDDLGNPDAIWRRNLPNWVIERERRFNELGRKIVLKQDEIAATIQNGDHSQKLALRHELAVLREEKKLLDGDMEARIAAGIIFAENLTYFHVDTGFGISRYFPKNVKDIELLHILMRNEFAAEVNTMMIGDPDDEKTCKECGFEDMPLYVVDTNGAWVREGSVEAAVNVMFDSRLRTFEVYDELFGGGNSVGGNELIKIVRMGGFEVELERMEVGLRLMRTAGRGKNGS